jgi:predicted PurR-regulated permease PerM
LGLSPCQQITDIDRVSTPTPLADTTLRKAIILLSILAVGALLYFAQDVFIPVAVSLFLALLLSPAVDRLEKWRVRRGVGVAIVLIIVFVAAGAAINAVWAPATQWLARAPQTIRQIDPRLKPLREMFARVDDVAERAGRLTQGPAPNSKPAIVTPVPVESTAISMARSFFEWLSIIPFTLFFMLGGPTLMARMGASLAGSEASSKTLRMTQAIRQEVGRYFGTVALINVGLGIATGLAMFALGMPNAILWGVMAGVLNFIPYLGPITACFILAAAALITFPTLGQALAVPGVFVLLHLIEGQLVQPLTVGRRCEVNALVVLLGVWFGFAFWGIAGVMLATPVLVALKVAAQHNPTWRVLGDFLSPNALWNPILLKRRATASTNAEAGAEKPAPAKITINRKSA